MSRRIGLSVFAILIVITVFALGWSYGLSGLLDATQEELSLKTRRLRPTGLFEARADEAVWTYDHARFPLRWEAQNASFRLEWVFPVQIRLIMNSTPSVCMLDSFPVKFRWNLDHTSLRLELRGTELKAQFDGKGDGFTLTLNARFENFSQLQESRFRFEGSPARLGLDIPWLKPSDLSEETTVIEGRLLQGWLEIKRDGKPALRFRWV